VLASVSAGDENCAAQKRLARDAETARSRTCFLPKPARRNLSTRQLSLPSASSAIRLVLAPRLAQCYLELRLGDRPDGDVRARAHRSDVSAHRLSAPRRIAPRLPAWECRTEGTQLRHRQAGSPCERVTFSTAACSPALSETRTCGRFFCTAATHTQGARPQYRAAGHEPSIARRGEHTALLIRHRERCEGYGRGPRQRWGDEARCGRAVGLVVLDLRGGGGARVSGGAALGVCLVTLTSRNRKADSAGSRMLRPAGLKVSRLALASSARRAAISCAE
jgi:hypothetical protein